VRRDYCAEIVAVYRRHVIRDGKRVALPYWYYDVTVGGKRERRSTGCPATKEGKALAEQIEAKARLEMQEDLHFGRSARRKMTLGQLHEEMSKRGLNKSYRSVWKRLLAHFGAATELGSITSQKIDEFALVLGQERALGTVAVHLVVLRAALKEAHRRKAIAEVPMVAMPEVDNERDRIWTPREFELFCRDADLEPPIRIGYYTGLRLGAICELLWEEVDLCERIAHVPKSRAANKIRPRIVPLHVELTSYLRSIKRASGRVVPHKPQTISLWFYRTKKDLVAEGLADMDLRFHDLRHSAATRLWEAGADPVTIAEICGWRSMQSLRRYLTTRPAHLLAAIDRVPSVTAESRTSPPRPRPRKRRS